MPKKYPKGFFDFLPQKIDEAIKFIQENEPPEGYYLGDSGGKDSNVIRDLAIKSGVKFQSYYSCTRIDPPEVVKFIKENHKETTFLFPAETYWHGIMTRFPPGIKSRWCCDVLKKDPGKTIPLVHRLFGIRAEESSGRKSRGKISKLGKRPVKQIHYHPIFNWSEYDVWEYIEKNNLPYCKLYDEGWSRIGCLCCPFASYGEHKRNIRRYPGIYKTFEKVIKQRWEQFKAMGKLMYHNSPDEYIVDWYKKAGILFVNEDKQKQGFGL